MDIKSLPSFAFQIRKMIIRGISNQQFLYQLRTMPEIKKEYKKIPLKSKFAFSLLKSINKHLSTLLNEPKVPAKYYNWKRNYELFLKQICNSPHSLDVLDAWKNKLPHNNQQFLRIHDVEAKNSFQWFFENNNNAIFQNYRKFKEHKAPKQEINFVIDSFLWKTVTSRYSIKTQLNHLLVMLDAETIYEFLKYFYSQSRLNFTLFYQKEEIQNLRDILSKDKNTALDCKGLFIDLNQLQQHIAIQWFPHWKTLPTIYWSKHFSTCKFAHYNFLKDEIVISLIFDNPLFNNNSILEFIIYHEMLHKEIGIKTITNNISHTKEFKERERLFPQYEEIKLLISRLDTCV